MANTAYPTTQLLVEPGYLYYAPIGSTLPANTVSGSVFTDSWPVAWIQMGLTAAGTKLTSSLTVSPIPAAEKIDPLAYRTTDRSSTAEFSLMNFCAANLVKAFNGATTTVTGSGATTLTKVTLPQPGAEVRFMLGWESTDSTVRWIGYQAVNSGSLEMDFAKAPANTDIPFTANFEIGSTGTPFDMWTAGTARA